MSKTLFSSALALAIATVSTFMAIGPRPTMAEAPMVKTPAPGYFRFMLCDFEVTALSDGTVDVPADQLLSQRPAETISMLARSFLKAPVETSVNAYLVNTGSKLMLFDTGAGALFGPTLGKLIINLKAAGYEAAQIDEVYLSHLHPDHTGGLTSNGERSFPNATVRLDEKDLKFWLSQAEMDRAPEASKSFFQGAMTSLNPYVSADKVRGFNGSAALTDSVTSLAGTGHTIGHTVYVVESKGQKLMFVGDLIHVPAVQLENPGVTIAYDSDPKTAAATRASFFQQAAKDGALIAASHIQFPGVGHLRSDAKGYQWLPINYTQMR